MPRNQESSIGHDPADSDDPLFRDRNGQSPDDPAPAGDAGDTPIGDELAAGRHAGPGAEATDSPGEWVAGSRGTGFAAGQDGTVVPEQADRPSVESTDDPLFGGRIDQARGDTTDTTGTTDPADVSDTADTAGDTEVVDDTADHPGEAGLGSDADGAPDLRATGDPEVAPDSALNRDYGAPTNPDSPTLAETPADADVATSGRPTTTTAAGTSPTTPDLAAPASSTDPGTTGTPETPATAVPAAPADTTTPAGATASTTAATGQPDAPVPGAPGTGSTTGVQAASASLVTNGAELHDDWARIQSAFVDDPQGSVSQAADLVTQVTNSLVSALQEREQTLRGAWDKQGADTENLRNALRDYRAFFEQLTKL
jgi:hypothetical protein